jgi:hypothetical protein
MNALHNLDRALMTALICKYIAREPRKLQCGYLEASARSTC